MNVVVIGGGAAGFFTAINIARKRPDARITLLEKTGKTLQKVKVSGGGRCNVTNARTLPSELVPFYPRGNKKLHGVFKQFSTQHMVDWLAAHGVPVKAEADLRMFPVSDSSQTIIDCFERLVRKHGIQIVQQQSVTALEQGNTGWKITTKTDTYEADAVVVATGSSAASWQVLQTLGLQLTDIVPSLFTFNIRDPRLQDLQGITFKDAQVKIVSTKLAEEGPMLITHWGLSGRGELTSSSVAAISLRS